jgi:malonate-semialdehyde dehydrogenase (acetylating)/methylmalonate-semialdehyde dehydrogenase
MAMAPEVESVPMLVGGRWETPSADRYGDVFNPSTGRAIARVPLGNTADVDRAVRAAFAAAPAWAETPSVERARILFRFRERLAAQSEELARLVTREHGKTLAESRASVQRGIEMVEFACGIPSLLMGQSLPNIASGVDCETARHPLGVCAGITPSNFPVMVPLWMAPIALACGNAFVLKPSEKVPLSAVRLGEALMESGLPEGVFNIVHGDRECVQALLEHPNVRAISFVGSTAAARYVYETAARHGKRVQAAGGAKNHLVIMPDADIDQAASAVQAAAFGCAGQRCMAGSVALPVGRIADGFVERLCARAAGMRVGPTDREGTVDMGPVISRSHLERVVDYLEIGRAEGAEIALDGRAAARSEGFCIGPSILDRVQPAMQVARDEIFGPVLSVVRVGDLDEALALGRRCPHGNGASIFTRSGGAAREFSRHFNAGMIGINVAVPAPMAWFPFTGWNQSFFGDLHLQGIEGVQFYTQQKLTMSRWPEPELEPGLDPIWRTRENRT